MEELPLIQNMERKRRRDGFMVKVRNQLEALLGKRQEVMFTSKGGGATLWNQVK